VHLGIKDHVCTHPGCGKRFASLGELKQHEISHSNKKPHQCSDCPKAFAWLTSLKKHQKRHEEQKSYNHVCSMIEGGTQPFEPGQGFVRCTIRCKTARDLDYHIQRNHTAEGLARKFESETKMAKLFDENGIAYDRDFMNTIRSQPGCYTFTNGTSARPDFHLLDLSSHLQADVLVGNDEFAHRRYSCDFRRLFNIANSLSARPGLHNRKLVYIRFNPHFYEKDGVYHDLKLDEAHRKLLCVLNELKEGVIHLKEGVNLIYMYYDCTTQKDGSLQVDVLAEPDGESEYDTYVSQYRSCVIHVVA